MSLIFPGVLEQARAFQGLLKYLLLICVFVFDFNYQNEIIRFFK